MKTVGIIGGLGPETSAKFQLKIISLYLKNNKKQRPPILSWNIPLPLKIEEDLIIRNFGEKRYFPFLIEAAKILEKGGADFLVMPCNTMHIFIEEIKKAVNIPVLSIVDETISVIKGKNISRIGILATSTTLNKKLFLSKLKALGIKSVIPNKKQQKKLDQLILRLAMSKYNPKDKIELDKIIKRMIRGGIKHIILACTDLQIIIQRRSDVQILDTMKILANASVTKINWQ